MTNIDTDNMLYYKDIEGIKKDKFGEPELKTTKIVVDKYGAKKEFLEFLLKNYNEDYIRNVYYTFSRCCTKEQLEGEDLALFNFHQMKQLITQMNHSTFLALSIDISHLTSYLDFCLKSNLLTTGINILRDYEDFTGKDSEKLMNKYMFWGRHFTEERISYIKSKLVNPQDKAFIQLVFFEGVKGKQNCEIINLKEEDVDWENHVLNLRDIDGKIDKSRQKVVSEETIRILEKATKQEEYFSNNGKYTNESRSVIKLPKNEYIFRSCKSNEESIQMSNRGFENRVRNVMNAVKIKNLTLTKLLESAMINKIVKCMEEKRVNSINKLETGDFNKVCNWAGKSSKSCSARLKRSVEKFLELEKAHKELMKDSNS